MSDPLLSLAGKTALITAGASGIGRASAELFASHGAHVIVADVDRDNLVATVASIEASGGSVEAHQADLADYDALAAFVATVAGAHEVIDVLFNHVGITGPPGWDYDDASWDHAMRLNAGVPAALTRSFLPQLRASKAASIIFTSSTSGLVGTPGLATYSATKGAVIAYMRSVALALAPESIRANVICPGGTDSAGMRAAFAEGAIDQSLDAIAAMVPMGRIGQPEDQAAVALFLAADASRYVTGVVIPVDGGATISART